MSPLIVVDKQEKIYIPTVCWTTIQARFLQNTLLDTAPAIVSRHQISNLSVVSFVTL